MIYVYAIVREAVPGLRGLRDAAVCVEDGAAYSELDGGVTAEPELLWRHEEVVEALMEAGPVLPMRFGTMVRDLRELRRLVSGRDFGPRLDAVRDCVEMSVRVNAEVRAPVAASGREYLLGKLAIEQSVSTVHARLGEFSRSCVRRGMTAAYLVPRDAVERFSAAMRRLRDANPELDLSCTGPWPPYSFVGDD